MKMLLCVCICLMTAIPIYAESVCGYTAEWLSHESSLIALATPMDVQNIKGPGEVFFTKTRFMLDEVIKGPQSNGDIVTVYDFSHNKKDALALADAKRKSKQLLIFCVVAHHTFKETDGKYIFTEVLTFKSAYYVNKDVTNLYTPDFRLLAKFDELLERTRNQANYEADLIRRDWKGKIEKKFLDVPVDSEAYHHLYAGSACNLWVPDYKEEK